MTITIDEDGILNTVSIDRATLVPLSRFEKRQRVHTPDKPIDKLDERVEERKGHTTTEEPVDAPSEYPVDLIVRHVGKAKTFNRSGAGAVVNRWTIQSSCLSTFLNSLLLSTAIQ